MVQFNPAEFELTDIGRNTIIQDLPNSVRASQTQNRGVTAPSYAEAGTVWQDAGDDDFFKIYDTNSSDWYYKYPLDSNGVIRTVAGDPNGLINSLYEDEIVLDKTNSALYQAPAAPSSSWVRVGSNTPTLPFFYEKIESISYVNTKTVEIAVNSSVKSSDNTTDIIVNSPLTCDLSTSGAGGLDTGTVAAGTSYHYYLIKDTSTNQVALMASTVNEQAGGLITLPSGFDKKRQIKFSLITNASANIKPFDYYPELNLIEYSEFDQIGEYALASLPPTTFTTYSFLAANLMPNNSVRAVVAVLAVNDSVATLIRRSFYRKTGSAVTGAVLTYTLGAFDGDIQARLELATNANQQIDLRQENVNFSVSVWGRGYYL